jgi:hypothetical protein
VRDYRLWWGLFVFFAVLSVLVVQRGYRRWRRLNALLPDLPAPRREEAARGVRLEGWRLACMAGSLVAMTALVFAALFGVAPVVLLLLRIIAISGVLGVVILGVRR